MALELSVYEALIDATGTGALSDTLLDAADRLAGIDEIFAYCREGEGKPFCIASSGHVGSARARADLYTQRFHMLDPLAGLALGAGKTMGMARLSASDVYHAGYRRECYDRPGFAEKIVFAHVRDGRQFVLSFYRRRDRAGHHVQSLSDLAELAFPVLRKHHEVLNDDSDQPIITRLERRLATAYPQLTGREREVCARSLVGMTAEAIALDLAVSEATVLTYRRRAYERYRISSSHEMIERILA